ncbi:MAG: polysaccharide biosynthesis/export family protein [Verrucomicrobiota bacterium]|jgi:protein involved in polysaccharide export with SLBB domain|nr:polysaccharide biosynthesis/export family protein [Verrucomicrobiota bacterium]
MACNPCGAIFSVFIVVVRVQQCYTTGRKSEKQDDSEQREKVFSLKKVVQQFVVRAVLVLTVAVAGGCRLLFPADERDPGVDLAVVANDGDPLIVSGLLLRVAVTASGVPVVKEELKEVNVNGEILMPLLDAVKCEGLTTVALEEKLKTAYKDYYLDPQASVGFAYNPSDPTMKSPWGTVLVMGTVVREGPVNMPSTRDLTVTKAVMMASGATPLANKCKVRVTRREADGSLKRFKVNIDKIGKEGRSDLDVTLKSGDVVWVPESWY